MDDIKTINIEAADISSSGMNGSALRRLLYALLALLAPAAGTASALFAALAYGVYHIRDASLLPKSEIEDASDWGWVAEFTSKHAQEDFGGRYITFAIIAGLAALAALIGMCIMTGRFSRTKDGEVRLNLFDRIWSEIHITAVILGAVGAVFLAAPVAKLVSKTDQIGLFDLSGVYSPVYRDAYLFDISNQTVFWYCTAGIAACIAISCICFISLVKKIKAHELLRRTLIAKLLSALGIGASWAGKGIVKAGHGIAKAGRGITVRNRTAVRSLTVPSDEDRLASIKLIVKYILIAAVLIGMPVFFMLATRDYRSMLICAIVTVIPASALIILKVGKLAEIRAGVIEVRSGNLSHKITVNVDDAGPKTDLDKLASDINHISEATSAAVKSEIRNQRLKTDLISNVSHDLKTPLTSMISYLDILQNEGLDSPDAPAHLAIVCEKTERLKTLTEELFEAAKASSGNIPCEIEKIDAAALIDQSLAEMGDRLSKKELRIRKTVKTDNTLVKTDGKLLYRVFENLLGNISKYALEGSRVYIDVSETAESDGRLLIEVKNISKEELNISADELMERFTRGDRSRNTEGSGLGLAIARDLIVLMGGVFDIKIDGDMFKASVLLERA